MRKKLLLFFLVFAIVVVNAQTPKLYVNIVSHNEQTGSGPNGEPYDTNPIFFQNTADTARKIADMVFAKNAKWNLQTCQRFVFASMAQENAALTNTDVLEYCYSKGTPGQVIEIDPRPKTTASSQYTLDMSDVAHMIDSTGAVASKNVGGFIYIPYTSEDWTVYTNTITGAMFHQPWKAEVIWGAGTGAPHPLHSQDASNYGIWKPNGATDSLNFYCHNPAQNVWLQGNGCAPVLSDTTADVQWIVRYYRDVTNKLQSGAYPADKFYTTTLMTNFKHYSSAGFRQRLTTVVDSINNMVSQNKIVWATISQKQNAFAAWSASTSIAYSQWRCGQTTTLSATCASAGLNEYERNLNSVVLFPNPAKSDIIIKSENVILAKEIIITDCLGRVYKTFPVKPNQVLVYVDVKELQSGVYLIYVDGHALKFVKE